MSINVEHIGMYTVTVNYNYRTIAIISLFHKGNGCNGKHRVVMDSGWKVGHPQIRLQTPEWKMFFGGKDFPVRLNTSFLLGHCCPQWVLLPWKADFFSETLLGWVLREIVAHEEESLSSDYCFDLCCLQSFWHFRWCFGNMETACTISALIKCQREQHI